MTIRKYGYLRDPADPRDWKFSAVHAPKAAPLPEKVSLRDKFKEKPYDQGQLGSCSAHAALGIFTFTHGGGPYSRLALYYQERLLEGTVNEDSGAFLRDAIKVLSTQGVGLEEHWPYDIKKFTVAPPEVEVQEALQNKITTYSSITDGSGIEYRQCLADGYPFMIGIQIFETFESEEVARSGVVPMPEWNEKCLGGHAVAVIGYNDKFKRGLFGKSEPHYEVRNSWGTDWGDQGHFWIPARYIEDTKYGTDAWTIRA